MDTVIRDFFLRLKRADGKLDYAVLDELLYASAEKLRWLVKTLPMLDEKQKRDFMAALIAFPTENSPTRIEYYTRLLYNYSDEDATRVSNAIFWFLGVQRYYWLYARQEDEINEENPIGRKSEPALDKAFEMHLHGYSVAEIVQMVISEFPEYVRRNYRTCPPDDFEMEFLTKNIREGIAYRERKAKERNRKCRK